MTDTIRIPAIAYQDVKIDIFEAKCHAFGAPKAGPKFPFFTTIFISGSFGQKVPGYIIGVEPRVGGKDGPIWNYHVIRPRFDGQLERVTASEGDLEHVVKTRK